MSTGFGTGANNGTFLVLAASAGEIEVPETAGLVDEAAGASVTMSQGSRYYVLGPSDKSYTIEKVRSPRDSGAKSEWDSGSYEFRQSTHSDGVDSWRVFQAIVMDFDNDGTPEGNALWRPGDRFLDMPTRFSRSDTVSTTGPEAVLAWSLEDVGVPSGDIDTGVGSSFETAGSTYSTWGLEFNGSL